LGGSAVDTRTHNALNEIETRDPGDDPSYDLGGDTVSVPVDEGTGSFTIIFDPYGLPSFYIYSGGSYLPAGNWTSPTGADFLFQGRWYYPLQTASGDKLRLYHFRNRAYATKLGRFLQRDPLTKEQEERRPVRPYSFVEGAPLSRVDPSGLLVVADTGLRNKPGGFPRSLISTLRDICPCYSYEAFPLYPWQQQT